MSDRANEIANRSFWEKNRRSHGLLLKKTLRGYAVGIIRALFLIGLGFMILQPMIMRVVVSFMAESDLYDSSITLLPRHLTLDNYEVCMSPVIMNYWEALFNSTWISFTLAILQVAACAFVGYGFARFDFRFKKFWFAMVILVIVVPPQTMSTSLYMLFANFDFLGIIGLFNGGKGLFLRDSFTAYALLSVTCMGLKNGLYIYLFRQHFKSFPVSLEEAAHIDGAGYLKTFMRVILPDAIPILISCFLFAFVWSWTDRVYTEQFLRQYASLPRSLSVIADNLAKLKPAGDTSTLIPVGYRQQMIGTGMILAITPVLILYLFAQRFFIESLSSTGLKD